ncbi:MAG: alpha/beta hydrolase [Gammaproteobacteria bacterium]|nr:alpha/beta hydrolase [Gammaproteobacteria bacterium]
MQGDAVVYGHGLWLSGREAVLLRRRIGSERGCRWVTFGYSSLRESLADITQRLAACVRGVAAARVHLVGHSLGGLVILRCVERCHDLPPGRVVFLGTPAVASAAARRVARLRIGRAVMGPVVAAELLRDHARCWGVDRELGLIAGSRSRGAGRLVTDFTGANDGTVAVAETRLPGATAHLTLPVSHIGMLLSARVAREVGSFLEHGRFGS